jgi:hypothetical protein
MRVRSLAYAAGVVVAVLSSPVLAPVRSADAHAGHNGCTSFDLSFELPMTLGGVNVVGQPLGEDVNVLDLGAVAPGFGVVVGPGVAETRARALARCTAASGHDASSLAPDLEAKTYGVLAGVAIPGTAQCPGDYLVLVLSPSPGAGLPPLLQSCLGNLASAPFYVSSSVTLSDQLIPGETLQIDLYWLPFVIAYQAVYFVVLTDPGAPLWAALGPQAAAAAKVCSSSTTGSGQLLITCR